MPHALAMINHRNSNDKPSELRRLKRIPGFTLLVPDNASMGTIKTTEAEILGVLVSIRREM